MRFAAAGVTALVLVFSTAGQTSTDGLDAAPMPKAVSYTTFTEVTGHEPVITRWHYSDSLGMRIENADGSLSISAPNNDEGLAIYPAERRAVATSTPSNVRERVVNPQTGKIEFGTTGAASSTGLTLVSSLIDLTLKARAGEELPAEELEGQPVRVFRFHYSVGADDWETTVWVNTRTELPLRVVEAGPLLTRTFTAIAFDAPLDPALFDRTPPAGFALERQRNKAPQLPDTPETQSMFKAAWIVRGCHRYSLEHRGQWPADVAELHSYGITQAALSSPRLPDRRPGYLYRPPTAAPPPPTEVVVYEAFDGWPDGVAVAFADGTAMIITQPAEFNRLVPGVVDPKIAHKLWVPPQRGYTLLSLWAWLAIGCVPVLPLAWWLLRRRYGH